MPGEMDDGSDGDVFFPVLQYTAVPQCSGSPEKIISEGKVLLQRAEHRRSSYPWM